MNSTVCIEVNGIARRCARGSSVGALLRALELPLAAVAVERNGALVRRSDFEGTELVDGDRLEIVTLVGGG